MSGNEQRTSVGDYVTLVRGTTYKGSLVGKPGPALLGLGSIEPGGGFRNGSFKTYGGDCPDELMLFPGDIYASLKGATKDGKMIGSVARVPPSVATGRLTQDTVKLVFRNPDPDDESYLHWVLRTPQYRDYCAGHAMGSAVVALSRRDFLAYPVPPLTVSRRIAVALLDVIERKIELNRKINETLEAMARVLFKSWFVDFAPVRAKSENRGTGLPKTSDDLFPDFFEESELGEIPIGWQIKGLDEIADFLNGLALQKYPPDGEATLPVIKIAQLRKGGTDEADRCNMDLPTEYVVNDGDILFSWSGSLECVLWTGGRGALNQHLFKVTSSRFPKWFYYLCIHQHLPEFRRIAAGKATTMGHIQRHHLTDAKIVVPNTSVINAADKMIAPLLENIVTHRLESRTLATQRDILLSRLLSGDVRVGDVDRVLEEAQT